MPFAFDESENSTLLKNRGEDVQSVFHLAANYHAGYVLTAPAIKNGDSSLATYRLAYPRAYEKYVKPFSEQWHLDENLAYSIMRQESTFKPEAKSFAFAYGLMQIIPPTGDEIAEKIGFKGLFYLPI